MEVEEEKRRVLEDVFGDSSDDEEHQQQQQQQQQQQHPSSPLSITAIQNPNWVPIDSINGLWLCPHFLSPPLQSSLLSSIHHQGWFTEESHNQAMRFGDLPLWALNLSDHIYQAVLTGTEEMRILSCSDDETCILPSHLLQRRPLFDQLIVNKYLPGEGICAHVDLMRFEDGIAIVSLESPCVMHFSPVETDGTEVLQTMKVPVYLTPGSLVIMWGDARYKWKHEINRKPGFQVWQGQDILQSCRTSVTLRKLCISV